MRCWSGNVKGKRKSRIVDGSDRELWSVTISVGAWQDGSGSSAVWSRCSQSHCLLLFRLVSEPATYLRKDINQAYGITHHGYCIAS